MHCSSILLYSDEHKAVGCDVRYNLPGFACNAFMVWSWLHTSIHMQILYQAQRFCLQAEHYDRTCQQQIDIGLLAPEEAQASAEQVQP